LRLNESEGGIHRGEVRVRRHPPNAFGDRRGAGQNGGAWLERLSNAKSRRVRRDDYRPNTAGVRTGTSAGTEAREAGDRGGVAGGDRDGENQQRGEFHVSGVSLGELNKYTKNASLPSAHRHTTPAKKRCRGTRTRLSRPTGGSS